jgi:glyoxylase-like metal-dependent hydrolase (beta-lactamase superfamily II)
MANASAYGPGIELVTTDGIFSLDGDDFNVTNNVWIIGDDREVIVFDAAHDAQRINAAVNGRLVRSIVCTHGHNDHINAARELSEITDAPIVIHPADRMLWNVVYPDTAPDRELVPGQTLSVAGQNLHVLHTPGHSPGCCCFHIEATGRLFSGDTLFCGGPGATGRSYSDFPTIVRSIASALLTLPDHTVVHTGHGDSTTIGAERGGVEAALRDLPL